MGRYHWILFDADNTLLDFDRAEHLALEEVFTRYLIPFTPENQALYLRENRALWAASERGEISREALVVERFRRFLDKLGRRGDPAAMNREYLDFLGTHGDVLPGAQALCAALAPRHVLAIVTNGVTSAQKGRYARCPLKEYIPHLFISQELGCQKPQAEFFLRVLETLGAQPERTVVVGDSLGADIQGAVNAHLDSVWYNPKGLPAPEHPKPTYTVESFEELRELLA